jgi:glutamyl-tRNA(Gln) amidotransferase subunit E
MVPTIITYEAQRQQQLVEIQRKLGRFVLEKEFVEVTKGLEQCPSKIVQNTLNNNGVIYGLRLEGFAGLLGKELVPGKRLGTEFSAYAKVAAGVGGLFHSDELPKYGIEQEHVAAVKKVLGCLEKDAFVLIADQKQKVLLALDAVYTRAMKVQDGVLPEVRNAEADGTTTYLRPMPGAARMYPETDVLPIVPDTVHLKLPRLLEETATDFVKLGLSKDLADLIARSGKAATFERFVAAFENVKPAFIAEVMLPKLRELKRKYNIDVSKVTDEKLEEVFAQLDQEALPKEAIEEVLLDLAKEGKTDFTKYKGLSDTELHDVLKKIVTKHKDTPLGTLMGIAMKELRGKADGKKMSELLKKMVVGNR